MRGWLGVASKTRLHGWALHTLVILKAIIWIMTALLLAGVTGLLRKT